MSHRCRGKRKTWEGRKKERELGGRGWGERQRPREGNRERRERWGKETQEKTGRDGEKETETGREGEKDRGRTEIGLRREKERWGRKRKRHEERQKLRQLCYKVWGKQVL